MMAMTLHQSCQAQTLTWHKQDQLSTWDYSMTRKNSAPILGKTRQIEKYPKYNEILYRKNKTNNYNP
jgi:hypothetical protein